MVAHPRTGRGDPAPQAPVVEPAVAGNAAEFRPVRLTPSRPEAQPFTVKHFKAWARELELDNGNEWEVEPFQEAFLEDLFSGVAECWLIIPEGNAKTTLFAGIALYHIEHRRSASVPIAASSRDQAEILFRQAEGFIQRGELSAYISMPGHRRIWYRKPEARLQVFAADDRTGDGAIYTLALIDELHRHRDLRLYRTWRGKLEKRGGQIGAISTRGEPGSEFEVTLERIRQEATDLSRNGAFVRAASPRLVLHEWGVPEGGNVDDMELVKSANPLRAVTVPMLREKRASPTMTLGHWRRFVCNLPTRDDRSAITEQEWYRAKGEQIPEGEPIWLGLDVGWKHDTTAAVPFLWRGPEERLLGPATILVPPRDGTTLDPRDVKDAIRSIHERNPIEMVVMDMSKAEDIAGWIRDEFGVDVIERPQTIPAEVEEHDTFMEALRSGWLTHTGDPGLTSHVLNAIDRVLPRGDSVFERPSQSRNAAKQSLRVIDALKAASMVHAEAVNMNGVSADEPIAAWG